MKKITLIAFIILFSILSNVQSLNAWGVWAHYRINKGALLCLPPEMGLFFYNHADFITQESVIPDIRKHTLNDKAEGPRHYIDIEGYNASGSFDDIPKTMAAATAKYNKDTMQKYGILPWYLQEMMEKLTLAFKNKNKVEILFLAADLGHYIGDAHMPLHTTINHDGQLTGQKGIHGFWESQIPEAFGKNYHLYIDNAHYIEDIEKESWLIVQNSFLLAPRLLSVEKELRNNKPDEKMYKMDANGNVSKNKYGNPIHNEEYTKVYNELLNGMVEKQMKAAVAETANFWFTAWVNAGKPDLTDLDLDYVTERNKSIYEKEVQSWKAGKIRGIKTINEY